MFRARSSDLVRASKASKGIFQVNISPTLAKLLGNNYQIGCIQAKVNVAPSSDELKLVSESTQNNILNDIDNYLGSAENKSLRETLKKLKVNKSNICSSDSLLTRLQTKGILSSINNIVDINALISMKSKCPVGIYDLDKLQIDLPNDTESKFITISDGKDADKYKRTNGRSLKLKGIPTFYDGQENPFGSIVYDSDRAFVDGSTKNILFMMISFTSNEKSPINSDLYLAAQLLLKHADAKIENCEIVTKDETLEIGNDFINVKMPTCEDDREYAKPAMPALTFSKNVVYKNYYDDAPNAFNRICVDKNGILKAYFTPSDEYVDDRRLKGDKHFDAKSLNGVTYLINLLKFANSIPTGPSKISGMYGATHNYQVDDLNPIEITDESANVIISKDGIEVQTNILNESNFLALDAVLKDKIGKPLEPFIEQLNLPKIKV